VAINALAAAVGDAVAGVAAALLRGKPRFLVPAAMGAAAGLVFSFAEPLAVRGGSPAQNALVRVAGLLGFGVSGSLIGCGVAWVCGVVARRIPGKERAKVGP
jgi:hypothetical protein